MGDLIYNLVDRLWADAPERFLIPDQVYTVFETAVDYITYGFRILAAFIGSDAMTYLMILFTTVLFSVAAYAAYSLVMYILRKIPFLGIRD